MVAYFDKQGNPGINRYHLFSADERKEAEEMIERHAERAEWRWYRMFSAVMVFNRVMGGDADPNDFNQLTVIDIEDALV